MGRGSVVLRAGGEVIKGGSAGWFGLGDEEATAGGEVAGDDAGDMIAVMVDMQSGGVEGDGRVRCAVFADAARREALGRAGACSSALVRMYVRPQLARRQRA